MSAVAKFNQVIGILAKEESSYGTAATLADASDGCTPYIGDGDPPAPEAFDYVFDGNLGRAAGTLAPQKKTTPNGRFRKGQFQCLPKGIGGSGYTSSAVIPPREVHRFLKAAGYTATFTTDHWDYTPTAAESQGTSLTLRQYMQGFQYDQTGVVCDFGWEAVGLGAPIWTFNWAGLPSVPTDQALPSVTYLGTSIIPPVATAVVGNLGSFNAAMIRKVSFKRNRKIDTARIAQTASGGHAGFVPGGSAPMFDIEVERTALVGSPYHTTAGIDAEALMAAATSVAVDVTYGSTTGNTWKHAFAQCQLVKVVPGNDGPLATITLSFAAHASTPSANDAEKITFS